MDFKLIIPRSTSVGNCPECNSVASMDRVRNDNLWDKILLKVFQFRSYHCRICKFRGRFFLYKFRSKPGRIILNYAVVAAIFSIVLIILNIILKN